MPTIIDGLPTTLWRGFSDQRHADALINRGEIRMRPLGYYREIEDAVRQDMSEGVAHLRVPDDLLVITLDAHTGDVRGQATRPGLLNFSAQFLNAAFLLCMSTTRAGAAQFGNAIVKITDTRRLIDALEAAVRSHTPTLDVAFVEAFAVRYDKGAVGAAPALPERMRLAYGQKEPGFAGQSEYRIAVVLSGLAEDAPEYLDIALEGVVGGARLDQ